MIGFYTLLVLGFCLFGAINVYAFTYHLLTSFSTGVFFEIIFLWVCIGPQIVLYYILKLRQSIASYKYLYDAYSEVKNVSEDLELQNIKTKKQYEKEISSLKEIPFEIIENQKAKIRELTAQRDKYKDEYIKLKKKYLEEKDRRDGL